MREFQKYQIENVASVRGGIAPALIWGAMVLTGLVGSCSYMQKKKKEVGQIIEDTEGKKNPFKRDHEEL